MKFLGKFKPIKLIGRQKVQFFYDFSMDLIQALKLFKFFRNASCVAKNLFELVSKSKSFHNKN